MAVKMATSKKMSMAGEAATNRITDTAAINCTMGAVTVVDMEVTNPVTVADMEVTDVINLEVTEVTKPGMVAGMADTEVTDTVMADTGVTDKTRGMAMDLLTEAWEAMAVTEPWEAMEDTEAMEPWEAMEDK